MSMINKGIPYFPTPANFFDEEVMELLEAKYGCYASYIVLEITFAKSIKKGIISLGEKNKV